jgi:L-aminopeptidase/D-esterase-like protein
VPFGGTPGQWNAITDVPGVEVGYQTIIRGEAARTGVTGIHPAAGAARSTRWRPATRRRTATAK